MPGVSLRELLRTAARVLASVAPWYPAHGERADVGRRAERAAAAFLKRSGYRVLGRNVRVPMGEADLVCEAPDRCTIVIAEVKSRRRGTNDRSDAFAPESAVTGRKREKLLDIVRYLARMNGWRDRPVRIDVLGVELGPGRQSPAIRHWPGGA